MNNNIDCSELHFLYLDVLCLFRVTSVSATIFLRILSDCKKN